MTPPRWHYPRIELAERVYDVLANGPTHALSLFGPRRTGKTQFLLHDLAPLAEARGHKVAYMSLWQALDAPLGVLLYELDRTLRSGSAWSGAAAAARSIAPKFKIRVPGVPGEMEVDLSGLKGRTPESHLLALDRYCERLCRPRRPTFLLFDEFQEIAASPNADQLIAALRTSLDRRREGLAAVFTGSSQHGLRALFTARQAPFFRFATPIDLPALDVRFVDHQLATLRSTSKARVKRETALEVFERFEANPMLFQRWLTELALDPGLDAGTAIERVQAQMADEFGFAAIWLGLSGVQRVVARLLAERVGQIYGQEAARRIEALTGETAPEASAIQSALKRLSRMRLAGKWNDAWRLDDPAFEAWVRDRPDSDF